MDGADPQFELRNRIGQHVVVDEEVLTFREIRNLVAKRAVTVRRSCIESAVPIGPGIRLRTADGTYDIIVGLRPSRVAMLRHELMQALGLEPRTS